MVPEDYVHWFVLLVIAIIFVLVYRDVLRPVISMLLGVMLFVITGVINPATALAGFANPSIVSVILLILLTAGLRNNYNIERLFDNLYKRITSYQSFLLYLMSKVAVLSSVINNTPVVALMTPYVVNWGKRNNIAPSKLLIPLSYATILGGMITIIGTSTTLVLNGFLIENDLPGLRQRDLFVIGIPVAIGGIICLTFISKKLLPAKLDILQKFEEDKREYLVQVDLTPDCPFIGKSILEADLRNLRGIYLVEIIRGSKTISPVDPETAIQHGDRLVFAGEIDHIVDLVDNYEGIILPEGQITDESQIDVTEVVISYNSSLIGTTIRKADFRERYDGAIVAIHRNGERLSGRIGDIKLAPGDALLVFAGEKFNERLDIFKDMFIISSDSKRLRDSLPGKKIKLWILLGITLFLAGTRLFSLFTTLMILFTFMVGFNLINMQTIKRDIDFNIVGIMVFSLALGQAMIKSGAGFFLAERIIGLFEPYGFHAIIIALLLLTTLLTSFVSNIGAVSITFPIALGITQAHGIDHPGLFLAVTYAASAAFITPIGYQTNMIIYGPGGYNFKDFVKIGIPFTVVYLIITYLMLVFLYG